MGNYLGISTLDPHNQGVALDYNYKPDSLPHDGKIYPGGRVPEEGDMVLYHGKLFKWENENDKWVLMQGEYNLAVYAICKDEIDRVDAWMKSMLEADYICVLDTGSSDGTYEALQKWQEKYPEKVFAAQKIITPWRFDEARNESMKLIPNQTDIFMCTDLDERLEKGWAAAFKKAWGSTWGINQLNYLYSWSHIADGQPARVFWYNKCHGVNWYWRYPVHEIVTYRGKEADIQSAYVDNTIWLHHWPDYKKSRSTYLSLLEQRAKEDPQDYYGLVYLAHEYYYQRMYQKCIDFIQLTVLPRALQHMDEDLIPADLYMFLGNSYAQLGNKQAAELMFKAGIEAGPRYRENYLCLANLYNDLGRYAESEKIVYDMFQKTRRYYSWLESDISWGYGPYDTLAVAEFYLGNADMAYQMVRLAHELNPNDERIKANVEIIGKTLKQK